MLRFALVVVAGILGTAALARHGTLSILGAGSSAAADCRHARHPVRVRLSRRRWPHIADHVADVDRRFPRVLHLDTGGTPTSTARRACGGVATKPGYDRDEYPPAASREGGRGAECPRYVRGGENRSAGAFLGGRL
jgi:hypothetical protein